MAESSINLLREVNAACGTTSVRPSFSIVVESSPPARIKYGSFPMKEYRAVVEFPRPLSSKNEAVSGLPRRR
jgi:hypothetical protein